MLRRLSPICLILALAGCGSPTPPTPPSGATSSPGAKDPEIAQAPPQGVADTNSAEKATELADATGNEVADQKASSKTKGSTKPKAAEGDALSEEQTEKEEPAEKGVAAALRKLRKARTTELLKPAAAELEKALEDEPDHVEGLLTLVQVLQFLTREVENDNATDQMLHKSVDLVERAAKADADLPENPGFRRFAATVYVNDARALAREKMLPESLASLRRAIEYGAKNFDELDADKDLAAVRELPEYGPLVTETKEKLKLAAEKEVAELLEENKPFDFNFDLEDTSGKKLAKADLAGKVLIVDIWGTWCPPCRMEIPHFVALDKEFREKGLQIIGLNQENGDDEEKVKVVKEFCEENGVTYPCALLNDEILKQVPDFEGFPTTLFIDRTGNVRLKAVGFHDIHFLRAAVEMLLKEKGPAKTDEADKKAGE